MCYLLFRSVWLVVLPSYVLLTLSCSGCFLGVNDDSSYESTLLKRAPGCEVWGYDYSVHRVRVASVPYPPFNSHPRRYCSGAFRLLMTPSSASVLTLSPGDLVGPTTIRLPIFTNTGSLIHSLSTMVRVSHLLRKKKTDITCRPNLRSYIH
jgi:hypothetical protein